MKKIESKRFGLWELKQNGMQQHGLKFKELVNLIMDRGKDKGITKKQALETANDMKSAECWYTKCNKYKVVKKTLHYKKDDPNNLVHDQSFDKSYHLSIRINMGKDHLCDWRDFQEIKNDLVGKEYCAVEIYPPESRVHDTDNVFHLWVFPKGLDIPIGWLQRDVTYNESPFQRSINE